MSRPLCAAWLVVPVFVCALAANAGSVPHGYAALLEEAIADHVVLSEVYYDSPSNDVDCFVELYNPTDAVVDLTGWSLVGLNGNGNTEYGIIPLSGSIASHGFFLVGQDGSVLGVLSDIADGNANYQNGSDGLKLKDDGGQLIDYIGYGSDPDINLEGQAYFDVAPGQSIERKSGPLHDESEGNGWDTQSNIDDLVTRGTPQPQNSSSATEDPPSGGDTTAPDFDGLLAVADAGFGGSLILSWDPAIDPEASTPITYRIYRATSSGGQDFGAPTDSVVAADHFADNSLVNGQTYFYVVRAMDAFGNEDTNSIERSGVPSGVPPAISAFVGTLHAHTSLSDGMGTAAQAFTHARDDAFVDVLALSEHTHQLTEGEYQSLRTDADTFHDPGSFVAIAGQEVGVLSAFGHLNVFDGPTVVPTASEDLAGTYDYVVTNGVAASFCHPADWNGSNFNNFAYDAAVDVTLGGIAVLSGGGPDYESRLVQAIGNGWHVGAVGDQDVHDLDWGDKMNPSGDILLTGFQIDTLDRDSVLDAVKSRRTYAFESNPPSDRIEFAMSALGEPMGSEIAVGFSVPFEVTANAETAIASMELVRDGIEVVAAWDDGTRSAQWAPTDSPALGSHYYYVRLVQADGDRLWSSPIWVDVNGQVALDPGVSPTLPHFVVRAAPNPVLHATVLSVDLATRARVRVTVADVLGRRVALLHDAVRGAGRLELDWEGRDAGGRRLAAGNYFVVAEIDGQRRVTKVTIAR